MCAQLRSIRAVHTVVACPLSPQHEEVAWCVSCFAFSSRQTVMKFEVLIPMLVLTFRVLCGSMLEEMNKMNDENATLREEKKNFAARLQQQQQQLQDAQTTAARARQTATRYNYCIYLERLVGVPHLVLEQCATATVRRCFFRHFYHGGPTSRIARSASVPLHLYRLL